MANSAVIQANKRSWIEEAQKQGYRFVHVYIDDFDYARGDEDGGFYPVFSHFRTAGTSEWGPISDRLIDIIDVDNLADL